MSDRTLPPGHFYRIAWILYLVLAVAGVVWIGARLGSIPLSLFLRWETAVVDLGLGVATGLALVALWIGARRVLPSARRLEEELAELLGRVDTSEVVALALLSGVAEEIFFRGAVQGAVGWPIATLAFTLLHSGPGRPFRVWTLFAGLAGLAFAGLVVWRGTLLAPIVAHVVVNAINLRHLSRSQPADEAAQGP